MEGVFSSSMYVSSNQKRKREPPKAGHLLFKSPSKKLAIGHFHWAEIGGTGRYKVITGRSTPSIRCSGKGHVSSLKPASQILTVTFGSPDASTGSHRTRPVHTWTHAQRVPQTAGSPDAKHR